MTEKKLIPFDLERALAGDKVVTDDGRTAIEIHMLKKNPDYPLIVVLENDEDKERSVETYTSGGKYLEENENIRDLWMAPKVKTYWENIYRIPTIQAEIFDSEDEAKEYSAVILPKQFIKTISFEVEVDE